MSLKANPVNQPDSAIPQTRLDHGVPAPAAFIVVLAAVLFALRLASPPNLLDQDQERPATYVLDVLKNGSWLCQRDLAGDITSKPPLYTWLCSLTALACGGVNLFALYFPGALSAALIALLLLQAGRRFFGGNAGLFAALAVMLTTAGLKQFGLARTDGVFAFTVTLAALLAFRAWNRGDGWTWFWCAAAASTLTKGPLGLLFAANGLLAVWWERKRSSPHPLRGSHLPGIGLFVLLVGGWFLLAYLEAGPPLVAKMLGRELLGHAVSDGKHHHYPGMLFYQPPLYYLGRAAPWSLAAIFGLWRIWKHPAHPPEERRFERFLFCWFLIGMLIMSLAPHQRADLLWPLMPAGALIAGRELDQWTRRFSPGAVQAGLIAAVLFALAGFGYYYFGSHARQPVVQQTVKLKQFVAAITPAGEAFPLTHVDDPMSTQVYLNTLRRPVSFERALELLRGPAAAFVVVSNRHRLESLWTYADAARCYELELLPQVFTDQKRPARLISNRPTVTVPNRFAFAVGALLIDAQQVQIVKATERNLSFEAVDQTASVEVTNQGQEERRVRLATSFFGKGSLKEKVLAPGEKWTVKFNQTN